MQRIINKFTARLATTFSVVKSTHRSCREYIKKSTTDETCIFQAALHKKKMKKKEKQQNVYFGGCQGFVAQCNRDETIATGGT